MVTAQGRTAAGTARAAVPVTAKVDVSAPATARSAAGSRSPPSPATPTASGCRGRRRCSSPGSAAGGARSARRRPTSTAPPRCRCASTRPCGSGCCPAAARRPSAASRPSTRGRRAHRSAAPVDPPRRAGPPHHDGADPRVGYVTPGAWKAMAGRSWRSGCPVGRTALRTLQVSYWGFDGYRHRGALVVAPHARRPGWLGSSTRLYDGAAAGPVAAPARDDGRLEHRGRPRHEGRRRLRLRLPAGARRPDPRRVARARHDRHGQPVGEPRQVRPRRQPGHVVAQPQPRARPTCTRRPTRSCGRSRPRASPGTGSTASTPTSATSARHADQRTPVSTNGGRVTVNTSRRPRTSTDDLGAVGDLAGEQRQPDPVAQRRREGAGGDLPDGYVGGQQHPHARAAGCRGRWRRSPRSSRAGPGRLLGDQRRPCPRTRPSSSRPPSRAGPGPG